MELLSLADAIGRHVHDGQSIALEGFTHLIPHAAGHEIIRQQRRNLHLIRMTPDLVYDQMIGMGCASRLTFSWGGNPGVGSLHRLREAITTDWPAPLLSDDLVPGGMRDEMGESFQGNTLPVMDVAPDRIGQGKEFHISLLHYGLRLFPHILRQIVE